MAIRASNRPSSDFPSHRLRLDADEAHVWYAWSDACNSPSQRAYYRSLLSEAEEVRLERFVFEHLKLEYLLTRALCRTVLSAYEDSSPRDWTFSVNEYGRPEIAPRHAVPLRFNLSNSRSLVVCVVTRTADAGIDVEEVDRPGDPVAIAEGYFSPTELQGLHSLPPERQRHRFFQLWTLKESYIKGRGMGLTIPLDQFSFRFDGPAIRVVFDPRLRDVAADWQFRLFSPSERHLLAVGLRRTREMDFRISLREVVPDAQFLWKETPCVPLAW